MHSPVKLPSTRNDVPMSGALEPLRARHTISFSTPSLNAIAAPEALVKAWARWATTANSSAGDERGRCFAESEGWVAIITPSLKRNKDCTTSRSEEHTSELQSLTNLVCRL